MAALDEILALEQGVKDADIAILTKKTQVLDTKKAINHLSRSLQQAQTASTTANSELLKLMQADVVSMDEYKNMKTLADQANDLVFQHRMELVKKEQELTRLAKEIEKTETVKKSTEEQLGGYGQVETFRRPTEEANVED